MTKLLRDHPTIALGGLIWLVIVAALLLTNSDVLAGGLTPTQVALWDLVMKAIGGIVAIVGATLAALKFLDEKARSNQIALMEAQKPFFTKRQEVYYELVSATSVIANEPGDGEDYGAAQDKFWRIYWGVLPLVTDDDVGQATNTFEKVLCSDALQIQEKVIALRHASMELARACRKSLGFS